MSYPIVHQRFNRKVINPIPAKFVKAMSGETVFLINLTDQTYVFHRSYGCYTIPGVERGQEYSSLEITGRLEHIDQGDDKYSQQITDGAAIADDLANQANSGILVPDNGESFMGVFVSPTEKPSRAMLEANLKRLNAFFDGQILLADQWWDDPRTHKEISALHRRAAKARNQTRPWTYESVNTALCPACGRSVVVGVAICSTCGAVIDEAKARKFFPERFHGETEAEPRPRAPRKAPTPAQA